jgi:thymidine kinase
VARVSGNTLVIFVDEAQRLELEHYEWLRDVQDELGRRGIRMFAFLVGQPGILNRRSAFRQNVDTSQIVARFMIDEMRFAGMQQAADLKMSLAAYDSSIFPEGSDWTYTRFFCSARTTRAFSSAHSRRFCGRRSKRRIESRGSTFRWKSRWSIWLAPLRLR